MHLLRNPPLLSIDGDFKAHTADALPAHLVPLHHSMVLNQSAYVPDWASCPPADHPECTVLQLTPGKPRQFALHDKALLFGRVDQVCDVVVSHVSSSRVHACLAFDADAKLHVADLGSTHGNSLLSMSAPFVLYQRGLSIGMGRLSHAMQAKPCKCELLLVQCPRTL